ncbi:hypothetical protein MARLIPOL_15794 [Marinobacter lipolyticus SM19]|uniref:Uncharacterized protein n=1 Tax=Marinobacter lipolyticus SM19 TaxID=1318628 RepID=R8AX04_9GAMM|nr:hypothetical protein MARLIPOL_15794 [Marinobacter lipolyticus SM19]
MVSRGQALWIVPHEVRNNRADSSLFVIQHDGCATRGAGTQFKWSIRILIVERLSVQAFPIVHCQVTMVEEDDMGRLLPGDTFTDRTMADVVVYRIIT